MTKPITTDRYTLTVNRGSCPRTAYGWRSHPASATIVIGTKTYKASLDTNERKPKMGWMARCTTDCLIECWGRTQVEAATAIAETLADFADADSLLAANTNA